MNTPSGNLIEVNKENDELYAERDGNIGKGKKNQSIHLCKTKFDCVYPQHTWHMCSKIVTSFANRKLQFYCWFRKKFSAETQTCITCLCLN